MVRLGSLKIKYSTVCQHIRYRFSLSVHTKDDTLSGSEVQVHIVIIIIIVSFVSTYKDDWSADTAMFKVLGTSSDENWSADIAMFKVLGTSSDENFSE